MMVLLKNKGREYFNHFWDKQRQTSRGDNVHFIELANTTLIRWNS